MKTKNIMCGFSIAVALQLGMLACSAQTNKYLFSGSKTNITLNPGTYIITAYGAPGASPSLIFAPLGGWGGSGAEMSAEFNFSTSTTLTLLVGGGGYPYHPYDFGYAAGGGGGPGESNDPGGNGNVSNNGGGDSSIGYGAGGGGTDGGGGVGGFDVYMGGGGGGFLGNGTNRVVRNGDGGGGSSFENGGNGGNGGIGIGIPSGGNGGYGGGGGGGAEVGHGGGGGGYSGGGGGGLSGGGGGSIIDSSAIAILAEVSGITSPDDATNGEIIITAVPTPLVITTHAAFGFTNGVFGFNVLGPSGSNVVIQASADLQNWVPLQTNLLGSGPLHFSDPQSTTNVQRFYRVQLSP